VEVDVGSPIDWEIVSGECHGKNDIVTEFGARRMSTSGTSGNSDHQLQNSVQTLRNWEQSPVVLDHGTLQDMVEIMIDGKFSEWTNFCSSAQNLVFNRIAWPC
jgi:hypothetical protein